jgi:UDP-2,4-diacetamido-2,4,6-trideoxy-beta-L-altropyranose hydrolase
VKIAFRADASVEIGTGHVMRCKSLAEVLEEEGHDVFFISSMTEGCLNHRLRENGFTVYDLFHGMGCTGIQRLSHEARVLEDALETQTVILHSGNPDILVIDHYSIASCWENQFRQRINKLVVIDDLANRTHVCDILVDQNLVAASNGRYNGLVPATATCLLGPSYALLRKEFSAARSNLRARSGDISRILVSFGGSDPRNETGKTLAALHDLNEHVKIDVLLGPLFKHGEAIAKLAAPMSNVKLHSDMAEVAELMQQADLCIGAGGSSTWERCCLGLPSIVIALAENQIELCQEAHRRRFVLYLGTSDAVPPSAITTAVWSLLEDPPRVLTMGRNALQVTDGLGVKRVSHLMVNEER